MDAGIVNELRQLFAEFLRKRGLRFTEERDAIFRHVCGISGHFELKQLQGKLEEEAFHVSKATLYSGLDLLVESGILVRHPLTPVPLYELKRTAEKHVHLFCMECHSLTDAPIRGLRVDVQQLKFRRFTAHYYNMYIFGLCSKCTFRLRQEATERQSKQKTT